MNKYEIRTQKKKDAIIKASLEFFREKGYTNTSINEIAAAANVSPVSIYNYYGNKEELVKECAALLLLETTTMVDDLIADQTKSFREKLEQAVSTCTHKPHELLDNYFSPEALDDKTFIELWASSVNKVQLQSLSAFIDSGKEEGAINPALSTETIMDFMDMAWLIQTKWETRREYREKTGDLYQLILFGLIGR